MHPFASRKPSHTDALPGVVAQPRGAPLDVPAGPASRTCIRARAAVRRDRDLSRLPAADRQARAGSTSWWLVSGWVQVILPLTTYFLPRILTTYHLPLTTYHLPLTTYHLPLTTYHLPLTTYHLPLTTYFLLVQLIESPIFTHVRLQLLEPEQHPCLLKVSGSVERYHELRG
jgi:hypothetical protein